MVTPKDTPKADTLSYHVVMRLTILTRPLSETLVMVSRVNQ